MGNFTLNEKMKSNNHYRISCILSISRRWLKSSKSPKSIFLFLKIRILFLRFSITVSRSIPFRLLKITWGSFNIFFKHVKSRFLKLHQLSHFLNFRLLFSIKRICFIKSPWILRFNKLIIYGRSICLARL